MSRKNKTLRAFLHQNQNPTIEQAWDAAWKHAQKTFHARSMRDMEERLDVAQAEIEALRAEVTEWKRVASAQAELHGEAEDRAERLAEALERSVAGFVALSGMVSLDSGARNYARLKAIELNARLAAYRKQGGEA